MKVLKNYSLKERKKILPRLIIKILTNKSIKIMKTRFNLWNINYSKLVSRKYSSLDHIINIKIHNILRDSFYKISIKIL